MNRIKKTQCSRKDCSDRGDVIFRKVSIPSVFGDELTGSMKPENGAYKNALVFYEASGVSFLYDSDGVYTKIANIEGEAGVISINGKQGVVTITLAELGGMTESQINSLITSKGYQTAAQVDVKVSTAKAGAIAESKTYTDIKIAQVESEIPAKTSDLVNDSNFQTSAQVDTKVAAEATARQAAITAVRNEIPDVIDSVTSTSTDNALSAKQGKLLNDRITNIDSRGRYLSTWDTTTGEPGTEPEVIPYAYRTGDYFIVSTVGSTNYRPTGSQYTGAASTVVETDTVSPNDTYLYDGTTWELIHTEIPQIAVDENLSTTSRNPVWNSTITNALGDKVDKVTGKQLSTEDYTTAEKNKLAGLENTVLESTTGQSTTAGMTQKAITDALASAGGVKVLTTADYNWPIDNPTSVALWLLPNGVYCSDGISVQGNDYPFSTRSDQVISVVNSENENNIIVTMFAASFGYIIRTNSTGGNVGAYNLNTTVNNTLTSTSTEYALSAKQGKVLKDLIDSLIIKGSGAPTTSTVGTVGKLYEDTTNGDLYQCTAVSGSTYTWEAVGGGAGGDVSFTDLFTDGSAQTKVKIGDGARTGSGTGSQIAIGQNATATGDFAISIGDGANTNGYNGGTIVGRAASSWNYYTVVVGSSATARGNRSIAIGAGSGAYCPESLAIGENAQVGTSGTTSYFGSISFGAYSGGNISAAGMIDVGSSNTQFGYNSTNYRLLTGLHDPVSDHDAATKKYVDEHSGGGGGDVSFTDLFADGSSQTKVKIGDSASSTTNATAVGYVASAGETNSVALGYNSVAQGLNSVALGANSVTGTVKGVVSIGGAFLGTGGYNNTSYRLLTNVHDGVNAHDAVNKQQLDAALAQITALEARIAALEGNA